MRSYLRHAAAEPTRLRALYVLIGESLGGMDEIDDEVANVNKVFRDHIAAYLALGQDQGEFAPTSIRTGWPWSWSRRSAAS